MSLIYPLIAFFLLFFAGRTLGRQLALSIAILMSFLSLCTNLFYLINIFFYGKIYTFSIASWIL